jgi:hypothetical protein
MPTLRVLIAASALVGCVAVSAASAGATPHPRVVALCSASAVAVSFAVVRGSQGAGQTSYALRVKNTSSSRCRTGGLARIVLLGHNGAKLPTAVTVACGNCAALVIELEPGISAWADARFSPDVPGPGEDHPGRCEPVAYKVAVTLPGTSGSAVGLIRPPTSVCSHGAIRLTYLGATKPST